MLPAVQPSATPAARRPWDHAVATFQSLVLSLIIALFIVTFVVQAFQIPSASMERTLLVGDYLLVDKAQYGGASGALPLLPYREVERGDIVVFHYPLKPEMYFVKRVVAVPGDRVRMLDKQLFVNGKPEEAEYATHRDRSHDPYRDDFPALAYAPSNVDRAWFFGLRRDVGASAELVVPPGQYFVLGDNRDDSQDSRYWGFVPRANIVGRPLLIYWSVRSAPAGPAVTEARGDTLSGLAYAVTHLHQDTRWERMLRIVR
jgi:signal peptidase I